MDTIALCLPRVAGSGQHGGFSSPRKADYGSDLLRGGDVAHSRPLLVTEHTSTKHRILTIERVIDMVCSYTVAVSVCHPQGTGRHGMFYRDCFAGRVTPRFAVPLRLQLNQLRRRYNGGKRTLEAVIVVDVAMERAGNIVTGEHAFLVGKKAQDLFRLSGDEIGISFRGLFLDAGTRDIQSALLYLTGMHTHMLGWPQSTDCDQGGRDGQRGHQNQLASDFGWRALQRPGGCR
jgi:hypothetical protein